MITNDDGKDFTTVAVVTGLVAAVGIITVVVVIFTGGAYFSYHGKKATRDGTDLQYYLYGIWGMKLWYFQFFR